MSKAKTKKSPVRPTFKVTKIKWDDVVDGVKLDADLPEEATVTLDPEDVSLTLEEQHDAVIDALTELHGFLIEGCVIEPCDDEL